MDPESRPTADAPIGELLSQLSGQTSRLVRDEIRLAQREFQESARYAGKGAGLISAAGLLAVLAVATLIAAGVAGLAVMLPVWAAALIIGVVLLALAGVSALISRREVERVTPAVPETMASVRNDIDEVQGAAHVRG